MPSENRCDYIGKENDSKQMEVAGIRRMFTVAGLGGWMVGMTGECALVREGASDSWQGTRK